MKNVFLFCCILFASTTYSQDTIYFDKNNQETLLKKDANNYEVLFRDQTNPDKLVARTYYASGQLETEMPYSSYEEKIRNGAYKTWYETGSLRSEKNFKDGKSDGSFVVYWQNGVRKREDHYKNGDFIEGTCWNEEGAEVEYYAFEIRPEFPGGEDGLVRYLLKKMKYPVEAKKMKAEGKILVRFSIEPTGDVSGISVGEGNHYLKAEAYRLVNEMPKWTPGYQDGEPVKVNYMLPLNFRL